MNKFIVFEGPDGCGKTTILSLVYDYLIDKGRRVFKTREPGGTELGEDLRKLMLKSNLDISAKAEALMMAASRAQLVDGLIKEKLKEGHVLTDRFLPSSLAYQGIGRDLGLDEVKKINDFATSGLVPDLTLYFSISYETSLKRKDKRGSTDNIEGEAEDFHRRINKAYDIIYSNYKEEFNMVKIDAELDIRDVFDQVMIALESEGIR